MEIRVCCRAVWKARTSLMAAFLLAALPSAMLLAQSSGLVVVTVEDPSAAPVASASVTLQEEATNIETAQISDTTGTVRFVSVKPGSYRVKAVASGFKGLTKSNVAVNVGESVTLALKLELGAVTEVINVSGAAPLLQTERGEMGQVIGTQQILDLPLNGRNPIALASLTAGVVPSPNFSDNPLNLSNLNINGGRGNATEILQDGAPSTVPENSPGTYAAATLPSVERVQEFKVQTSSFSAEFGRTTGGVINLVLKSGTNQVHGSVYEFLRNSKLDSNDWFLNRAGRQIGSFKRNQYGFTLGGPVFIPGVYNGKNRTFFFGGFEGVRQRSQQTFTTTLPTAAQLGGDFSETRNAAGAAVTIFDPQTTIASGGGFVRTAFPGNRIPAARLDPVARRLLSYYPAPNQAGQGAALLNNFLAASAAATDDDNFDVRLDHMLTPRQSMFGRASYRDYRQVNPNFYGTIGQSGPRAIPRPGHSGVLNYSFAARPNLLLETVYGYARLFTNRQSFSFGSDVGNELGWPADLAALADRRGLPSVAVQGYGAIGEAFNARFSLESHSLQQAATWTRARHTMKFGGQARLSRTNFYQGNNPAGQFNFNAGFTQGPNPTVAGAAAGHAVASMLLGSAAAGLITHDTHLSTQSPYYALFAQEDFKVRRSLTLNFGMRWEVESPRSERYNRLSVFDSSVRSPLAVPALPNITGGLRFNGKDRERQFDTDWNNFGPRFGFAWQGPKGMVVRGGYALFYSVISGTAAGTLGGGGNAGFASTTDYIGSVDGGLTPADRLANPFPRGFTLPFGSSKGLSSFGGLDFQTPNLSDRTPYVQQWNVNIQRELMAGMLLEVGYSASKGTRLLAMSGPINQLTPEALRMGSALLDTVPNPFAAVITDPTSVLSRPAIPRGQLLRPYPQFRTITMEKPAIGNSIYHSLQVRVDRRFRNGFSLLAAYTWSKSIDDTSSSAAGLSGALTAFIQDWHNLRGERSLSTYDVAQRLVMSGTYDLPVGRGKAFGTRMNRVADALVGGWQVNGILTLSGGRPLVLANGVNTSNSFGGTLGAAGTALGLQRPNNSGTSARREGPVADRLTDYFTRTVFSQPAPFTHGNTSRTLPDVRVPRLYNVDLSLFKSFKLREGIIAQVRAESFNFTNTPIFGAPGVTFGVAAFGVIAGTGNNPRQVQLGLRLQF